MGRHSRRARARKGIDQKRKDRYPQLTDFVRESKLATKTIGKIEANEEVALSSLMKYCNALNLAFDEVSEGMYPRETDEFSAVLNYTSDWFFGGVRDLDYLPPSNPSSHPSTRIIKKVKAAPRDASQFIDRFTEPRITGLGCKKLKIDVPQSTFRSEEDAEKIQASPVFKPHPKVGGGLNSHFRDLSNILQRVEPGEAGAGSTLTDFIAASETLDEVAAWMDVLQKKFEAHLLVSSIESLYIPPSAYADFAGRWELDEIRILIEQALFSRMTLPFVIVAPTYVTEAIVSYAAFEERHLTEYFFNQDRGGDHGDDNDDSDDGEPWDYYAHEDIPFD